MTQSMWLVEVCPKYKPIRAPHKLLFTLIQNQICHSITEEYSGQCVGQTDHNVYNFVYTTQNHFVMTRVCISVWMNIMSWWLCVTGPAKDFCSEASSTHPMWLYQPWMMWETAWTSETSTVLHTSPTHPSASGKALWDNRCADSVIYFVCLHG